MKNMVNLMIFLEGMKFAQNAITAKFAIANAKDSTAMIPKQTTIDH
jgi:hypothetical protein